MTKEEAKAFFKEANTLDHLRIASIHWMDIEELYQAFKTRLQSESAVNLFPDLNQIPDDQGKS